MIIKKEVFLVAKKVGKKMSATAFTEIDKKVGEYVDSLILSAKKKADISGRVTIKPEDLSSI